MTKLEKQYPGLHEMCREIKAAFGVRALERGLAFYECVGRSRPPLESMHLYAVSSSTSLAEVSLRQRSPQKIYAGADCGHLAPRRGVVTMMRFAIGTPIVSRLLVVTFGVLISPTSTPTEFLNRR